MTTAALKSVLAWVTSGDAHPDAADALRELEKLEGHLQDLREVAYLGPHQWKGTRGGESYSDWRSRIKTETDWVPARDLEEKP